ncbi:hypothetical protein JCM4814A_00360 [Streptomyces phaeofaciens JCM 4814]|uniref:Uncharacterized protein n=1 Tax=Streptomyces phaeofaciens TaxID=68254 RepID=A0A918M1W2_9ACTN|nr:hypothetical protein GCM10010226_87980 [Streptomyces phaeofaciens]
MTLVGIGSEMKTSYAKSVWEAISTMLFSVWWLPGGTLMRTDSIGEVSAKNVLTDDVNLAQ